MDFGGASASRAADGLAALPPLPPETQRCALTAEESTRTGAGGPPPAARAWKILAHTPFRRPADEAVVECLSRAVDRRCIDPTTARLQHMDDPADDTAIINPRLAPSVGRQRRFEPCKLPRAQPKMFAIHRSSSFGDRESQTQSSGESRLWVRSLAQTSVERAIGRHRALADGIN
jgi:hypothetical protein